MAGTDHFPDNSFWNPDTDTELIPLDGAVEELPHRDPVDDIVTKVAVRQSVLGFDPRYSDVSRRIRVLELRGILSDEEYTYEEVGRELGITRERVRQIEGATLSKVVWDLRLKRP